MSNFLSNEKKNEEIKLKYHKMFVEMKQLRTIRVILEILFLKKSCVDIFVYTGPYTKQKCTFAGMLLLFMIIK